MKSRSDLAPPQLLGVQTDGGVDPSGGEMLRLLTRDGQVRCRLHRATGGPATAGVVWVAGARGGLVGPAGGLYQRLARRLRQREVHSLEVDYRRPGLLDPCVVDALTGVAYLEEHGAARIALVGHSFGGAVVIRAGALRDRVVGVAALGCQRAGTERVADLAPRSLLVAHGEADEVLPVEGAREIYRRAEEPKEIVLYPGCRHGLDACRDALERDLLGWLEHVLRLPVAGLR